MYVVLHVLRGAGNAEFYWLLCLMKLRECANMQICKYATNLTNVVYCHSYWQNMQPIKSVMLCSADSIYPVDCL